MRWRREAYVSANSPAGATVEWHRPAADAAFWQTPASACPATCISPCPGRAAGAPGTSAAGADNRVVGAQKSVTSVPPNSSLKNFIKAGEPRHRSIM